MYKRQSNESLEREIDVYIDLEDIRPAGESLKGFGGMACLLYTSDAADDVVRVDLGGRRIIKNQRKRPSYQSWR